MNLTDNAVQRIRTLQEKENKPGGALRLRIIAGGCSGMQYRMDLTDRERPNDNVFEKDSIRVFVDPKSHAYLDGSDLDWEEDLFGGEFKIRNPNSKTTCSCGMSFTV